MNLIKEFKIPLYFLITLFLIACVSKEHKTDAAFADFKRDRMIVKDSITPIEKEVVTKKIIQKKKVRKLDEWSVFKNETENKILRNERAIKEMQKMPNVSANLLKKINNIEIENNEIRNQYKKYKEEEIQQLKAFEVELNNHINEINIEINRIKPINTF